ncbi:MAG TPA: sigma-70 family RNA polymerase sigma factor [Planctomycetota bacterium]|nr:sigma-70 family RNA polymerase sigma factor [Planctomycetota bacterium]
MEQHRHDRFIRLYVANEEALRGFVRLLVPTREDAREVMQEVAAVLWRKFDDQASDEDFRRWAFGVSRFEALAFFRDRARDRHVFSDETIALLAQEVEQQADPLEAERQALHDCLRQLPDRQRALVESAYAPGVRIDDLASSLGRSAMSLYKALHRIRMTLVECTGKSLQKRTLP